MSLALKYRMKKMAKGGEAKKELKAKWSEDHEGEDGGLPSGGWKMPYEGRVNTNAYSGKKPTPAPGGVHTKMRSLDLKSGKYSMHGPKGKLPMAEGGQVCMHCGGMGYSEGGEVANTDLPEADFQPNEFDVLHLEDNLESPNTGENSGDYDGDDVVKRAMAKRKK